MVSAHGLSNEISIR